MKRKSLRTGFSTGAAAAAGAKAALQALLTGDVLSDVQLHLPTGDRITIPVHDIRTASDGSARASVIKDAGDDPDVTHRAEITTAITLLPDSDQGETLIFRAGPGVGMITRPGLPLPVGEPAINPGPRQMIQRAMMDVWENHAPPDKPLRVEVEISVKDGERLARRTLNPRLGIEGGLSILGTTGLVKPFSHDAYTATIESGMSVARAMGLTEIVVTTGGRSEKWAMNHRPDLPEPAFIQIADFFGYALEQAKTAGFSRVGIVSFFGKAVKQAQGLAYTHAHNAPMEMDRVAAWFESAGASPELAGRVGRANTARHALELLREFGALHLVREVGRRMLESARGFAGPDLDIWVRIIDFDGSILYRDDEEEGP